MTQRVLFAPFMLIVLLGSTSIVEAAEPTPKASAAPAAKAKSPAPSKVSVTPGLVAAPIFERIVGRVWPKNHKRFINLYLEANNADMRGKKNRRSGAYRWSGAKIADKWRSYVSGVRGVFVLRDSLYSQQDHPYRHKAFAPMLPPNWVTIAAHYAQKKTKLPVPKLPDPTDHAAWAKLTKEEVFGLFPISESLYERAVLAKISKRRRGSLVFAINARASLRFLMSQAQELQAVATQGPEAVAKLGAELISKSDVAYFGEELRRCCVIPIFVEHPNPKEVGEGKGVTPPVVDVSSALVDQVTTKIYRRRLQDGDLAIERYDLSNPNDRARAIRLLEALIPKGETTPGSTVWLWVNGKLNPKKKLRGEGPLKYVPSFRKELAAAKIELSRLELFAKPTVFIKGSKRKRKKKLLKSLEAYNKNDVMMSVSLPAPALVRLLSK